MSALRGAEMSRQGLMIPREMLQELMTGNADHTSLIGGRRTPQELLTRRRTPFALATLFRVDDGVTDGVTDGVSVTSYGQGQVTGGMFTVPAHGEITVDFELHLLCVTPQDVQNLSALIRALLDASHQHVFDDLQKTDISGGASLFGFFSFGVSASYSDVKHTMDSWGLSEVNQQTIVNNMMQIAQKTNDFKYAGTVYNRDYDYAVTGNLFGIVMDATIQQQQSSNQVRFLAPNVHLQSTDGSATLPVVGNLY
jgi:hypothetical protein